MCTNNSEKNLFLMAHVRCVYRFVYGKIYIMDCVQSIVEEKKNNPNENKDEDKKKLL